jgi:hypothetical protein
MIAKLPPDPPVFLRAEWRHLLFFNFTVDPGLLQPYLPAGTELDDFNGRTFVSLIGFQFLRTRVFGIPFPFHTSFEEVNLRFYVRHRSEGEWRRGVVFLRELVTRTLIALIARRFYGEPYLAVPMRHEIERTENELHIRYSWRSNGRWNSMEATGFGEPESVEPGSGEEFITSHYWGYTALAGSTIEYRVERPDWRIWKQPAFSLDCRLEGLCPEGLARILDDNPSSVFIADGSSVVVRAPNKLH